jgi:hypothetical protein
MGDGEGGCEAHEVRARPNVIGLALDHHPGRTVAQYQEVDFALFLVADVFGIPNGDALCGTFDLPLSGTKTVELSGHFNHTFNDEPAPG